MIHGFRLDALSLKAGDSPGWGNESLFLELAGNQVSDGGDGGIGVQSFRADSDHRAVAGGEHHQAHDAFAINFLAVLFNEDIRFKAVRHFDELSRWSRMDTELIEDCEFLLRHRDVRLREAKR